MPKLTKPKPIKPKPAKNHLNEQAAGAILQAAATIFAARVAAQPDSEERVRETTGEEAEINFKRCVEIALNGMRHLRGTAL